MPWTTALSDAPGSKSAPLALGAVDNGVTQEELIEAITHVMLYAGWRKGMSAMVIARKLFTEKK